MADDRQDQIQNLQQRLQTLQQLTGGIVGRANMASKLGYGYGGDRNIYTALGYKTDLLFSDYYAQYRRQDIAKAIIDRPVGATWRGDLTLLESDDDNETPFEKKWKELESNLHIKSKLARVDRLTGLGHYGVLLLGLDDVRNKDDFQKPVQIGGGRKLLYLKPLSENSAQVKNWESNTSNERYGLPTIYELKITSPASNSNIIINAHHSRVIHIPSQLMESEVQGLPRLEAVFNRLKDLEKLVGASAEMFWRGARPGYQGKVDKEYQMTDDEVDKLQSQIDEYEHNLRRIMVNEGVNLESLAQQVADPKGHVDVQIEMISAITGIPKRILTGSERGEQASTQDRTNWLDLIQERREEYAEPSILRPTVDRLIEYKVLPTPTQAEDQYSVQWQDLWAPSAKEKADVGKVRADALKAYSSAPANMDIVPPDAFYQLFLGLDEDQIELINEQREAEINEEEIEFAQSEQEEEE